MAYLHPFRKCFWNAYMSDTELEGDKIGDKRTVIQDLVNYSLESDRDK